jgi:hypothetical protein
MDILMPSHSREGKDSVLYRRYLARALEDLTQEKVNEVAEYLDRRDRYMAGREDIPGFVGEGYENDSEATESDKPSLFAHK